MAEAATGTVSDVLNRPLKNPQDWSFRSIWD